MKKGFIILFLLFALWGSSYLQAQTVKPVPFYPMLSWDTSPYKSFRYTRKNAEWEWINFRLLFPNGYDSTAVDNKEYPLIIVLHGAGESGRLEWKSPVKQNHPYPENDPRRDNNEHHLFFGGKEHLEAVKSNRFPGFVLFPQNSYASWVKEKGDASSDFHPDLAKAVELVEYLVAKLKVDPDRIYIHGLSAGGVGTWLAAYKRPDLFAAALPMSAHGDPAMAGQLKQLPLWVFQGELDTKPRPQTTRQTVDAVLQAGGHVRYSEYLGEGHNTWNRAYKEKDFFEWMLSIRKGDRSSPNSAPLVNAGADKTITLPTTTASLTATASDTDGEIASWQWEKVSGPAVNMEGEKSSTLSLSGLGEGVYVFRISVLDNKNALAIDEVLLEVKPAPIENKPPTVNAGTDKTLTLPTNTVTITATASDPDGDIASWKWEKVNGPAVEMTGANSATLSLSGMAHGAYTFRITVTDNKGSSFADEVRINVFERKDENNAPLVNVGGDTTVHLPLGKLVLEGVAEDIDGTIAAYSWEKISGPEVGMANENAARLEISNFEEGVYVFRFTATDNAGASGWAEKTLNVAQVLNTKKAIGQEVFSAIAYPNPFGDFINLETVSTQHEVVEVALFDALSRKFYVGTYETSPGVAVGYRIELPGNIEPGGVYIIQLRGRKGNYHQLIRMIAK